MRFPVDVVTLTLIALLAALVAAHAVRGLVARVDARRVARDKEKVRAAITDYFSRSGVQVGVECAMASDGERFVVMIESEPMKRFRLSHIIEMTLRAHVNKTCGLNIERIYWRFPIKASPPAQAGVPACAGTKPAEDDYINEGLEHYRHIPMPEVTELPWESFEQAIAPACGAKQGAN